jgi:hypothetical protein
VDETQRGHSHLIDRAMIAGLALCVALPLAALLVRVVSRLPAATGVLGDPAVIELYTLRATTGDQLLGPYSRFGFHHPGPLAFYCLAPFYLAFGKTYAALCVGALVFNLAWLIGIAAVVWRLGGSGRWPSSLVVIGAYIVYLGPTVLASAWNPDIAILPLAFALVSSAAVVAGHTAYLPAAAFAASFAVQSHLACAGAVACVAFASLVALIAWRGRQRAGSGAPAPRVARHVTMTAILLVVVWLPPFIEQLRDDPGNLTLILRFLGQGHGPRDLGASLVAVATQASAFLLAPFGLTSQGAPPPTLVPVMCTAAAGLLLVLVLGAFRGWRRRDAFALASCVTTLCLLIVGLFVTRAVVGHLHAYLMRWVSAVGLLGCIAVVAAFFPARPALLPTKRLQLAACAAILLVIGALALRQSVRFPRLNESIPSAMPERLSGATVAALAARGIHHPHVRILSHDSWEEAAGVVLQCEKAGRPATVDQTWLFMFGQACRFRGADDGVLLVADPSMATRLSGVRTAEQVAINGKGAVFLAVTERAPIRELRFDSLESEIYLRGGFSRRQTGPAGGFRWSNGPASWIVLPASPGPAYQLQVLACPIAVGGQQQRLTVEVNGHRVAMVEMKPEWINYSFSIPDTLVHPRNLIAFRYSFTRSPHQLAGTGDRRQLTVRYRAISLSPLPQGNETTGSKAAREPGSAQPPPPGQPVTLRVE